MTKKFSKDKQPWNPFPLAVLDVRGISPCAKAVLIVLGARSNYKGETCVGHRRLQADLGRSKDFVTKGLQELYDKGIVAHANRNRSKSEAEWRTISQSVLKSRTKDEVNQSCPAGLISPEEQDYVSPEEQDFVSPDQQGKTLQIKTTPNLTDSKPSNLTEVNLADEERKNEQSSDAARPAGIHRSIVGASSNSESSPEASHLLGVWFLETGFGSEDKNKDNSAAAALIESHGFEAVNEYLADTFLCPKTAKITWRDFGYWAQQFDYTRRTIDAWRRVTKIKAKAATAVAANLPQYRRESGQRDILGKGDI